MAPNQVVEEAKTKFDQAIKHFQEELKKIRTGRAHPSMLEGVVVEAYGAVMPLAQVASISVPEPQLLQITPFDPGNLAAIADAIRNHRSLGLSPMDDGRVVRVAVPALTEELRRDYARLVGAKTEAAMIAFRGIRHEAMDGIDKAKKDGGIGEDEAKRFHKQIDEAMAAAKTAAESNARAKEQEILTV